MPLTDDGHGRSDQAMRGRRQRLDHVLDLIIEEGHLGVDELVERLGVSPATARRDLDALAEQQLVIRTHGGASSHPDATALPMRYRAARNADAKEAIARCAVELAVPGTVVGLNGGTTTTALAHEFAAHPLFSEAPRQTVLVTNAINIAQELAVRRHLQLVVTGGVVREASFELVGSWAEQLLAQIRIDTMFVGVDGLTAVDGALTHDESEASITGRLIERAARVVVVADAAKVGTGAFARIAPASRIDDLVTDAAADPDALAELRAAGVSIHVAEHGGAPTAPAQERAQ